MYIEEIRHVVCTRCPRGCYIDVTVDPDGEAVEVTGARCKKGEEKAAKDAVLPQRIVTALVTVNGALEPASAKTSEEIPLALIESVLAAAKEIVVDAPVKRGQILCEDIAGTGAALVAAKEVEKKLSDEAMEGKLPGAKPEFPTGRVRRRFN